MSWRRNVDLGDIAGDNHLLISQSVRNIIICLGVVFWASSRMKESLNVHLM